MMDSSVRRFEVAVVVGKGDAELWLRRVLEDIVTPRSVVNREANSLQSPEYFAGGR